MFIKVIHNINPFQIFQTLRFGAFIIISIFLAKSGVDASFIGAYEYVLMIGGSAAFFWLGGYLTTYLSKSANADGSNTNWLNVTFYTMLACNIAAALLIVILFLMFRISLFHQIGWGTIACLLLYHSLNNISYINEHYLLAKNQQRWLIHYGIINFLLIITGAIVGFKTLHSVNGILIGLSVVSGVKSVFTLSILNKENGFRLPSVSILKIFLWQGAMIGISILLGSLGDYLDEYLVRLFYNDNVFAVYKMGAREFPLLSILSNSMATILIVLVAKNGLNNSIEEVKKKTSNLIRVITPLMCVAVLTGRWLFPFFYNQQFIQSATYFNLYALLCVSRFLFPQSIIIALQLNKYLIWASIAETILHLFLSLLLVHIWGVYGIIAGFLIASLLDKILLAIFVYKKTGNGIGYYTPMAEYAMANGVIILSVIIASVW